MVIGLKKQKNKQKKRNKVYIKPFFLEPDLDGAFASGPHHCPALGERRVAVSNGMRSRFRHAEGEGWGAAEWWTAEQRSPEESQLVRLMELEWQSDPEPGMVLQIWSESV